MSHPRSVLPRTIILVLAMALATTACGRRGALEPPPGADSAQVTPIVSTSSGLPAEEDISNQVTLSSGNELASEADSAAQGNAPKKRFFLDWLM